MAVPWTARRALDTAVAAHSRFQQLETARAQVLWHLGATLTVLALLFAALPLKRKPVTLAAVSAVFTLTTAQSLQLLLETLAWPS